MKISIGTAAVALAALLACDGAAPASSAATPTRLTSPSTRPASATDLSAQRRVRHTRYVAVPAYQPYYYARPVYYQPYPYVLPAPFFLGFAFGPRW